MRKDSIKKSCGQMFKEREVWWCIQSRWCQPRVETGKRNGTHGSMHSCCPQGTFKNFSCFEISAHDGNLTWCFYFFLFVSQACLREKDMMWATGALTCISATQSCVAAWYYVVLKSLPSSSSHIQLQPMPSLMLLHAGRDSQWLSHRNDGTYLSDYEIRYCSRWMSHS